MIKEAYSNYYGSKEGFSLFHNEVINMPREKFSHNDLRLIRTLASYLLLLSNRFDEDYPMKAKMIMKEISILLKDGYQPTIESKTLEDVYFNFDISNINQHYDKEGRKFRHLIDLCKVFNLVQYDSDYKNYLINFERCKEFALANDNNTLSQIMRNIILEIDVKDNPFMRGLHNTRKKIQNIDETDIDLPIAEMILDYIKEIKRPVTPFEVSILIGRVDHIFNKGDVLNRALDIGRTLPRIQSDQISYFFNEMGWINENLSQFQYSSSQQPWFKFNTFLILMVNFELLEENRDGQYILTEYSKKLLNEIIDPFIIDLELLLERVDNDNVKNSEIENAIINSRSSNLSKFISKNDNFIELINSRGLKVTKNKHGQLVRNKLVMLFSKISKDYTCDVVYSVNNNGKSIFNFNKKLFSDKNGNAYCEGHHIIEFSRENGPDVVENIILVDPNTHMFLHHAHHKLRNDLYAKLRMNNIISLDMFKDMIQKYNCLTEEHVDIIYNKGIIHFDEVEELKEMIQAV